MKKILSSILFTLLLAGLTYGQPYSLNFRYVKGESYRYSLESNSQTMTEMNGQERQSANAASQQALLTVDDIAAGGNISFISQWEKMETKSNFNGRDTTIQMKNLIGKRSRIEVSAEGKILKTSMIDSIVPEAPRDGARPGNNRGGGPGGMMFRGGRGGNSAIRLFYPPSKPVASGDSWQLLRSDTTFDQARNAMVTTTKINYKLGSKETKNGVECLKITYKGTKTIAGKTVRGGNESVQDSRSEMKGTIWFDAAKGIVNMEEFSEDSQSTMAITGDRAMMIPSTTFMKGTYTLVN
jgi:hypothetical protein